MATKKNQSSTKTKEKNRQLNNPRESGEENQELELTESSSDITEILHRDHSKVSDMFFKYTTLDDNKAKQQLAKQIIQELFVHTTIEEEVVYSKVREEGEEKEETKEMMDEADTEHHMVKVLMAELAAMKPADDLYDAKVTTLGEMVRHHVREEEKYMFDKMRMSGMDLEEIGSEFIERKGEIISEYDPDAVKTIWDDLKEFQD
jgi:hemerythrin superfamily protein